ncbi:MAG: hypothetical protein IVW52_04055 [Acidimicrobiales bacterium]|nr:hypothetical protein [Acidimicrobiales bacterium]
MTVVLFASAKGAPGVTTLATLTAATWPARRRVIVVECDPSGADLAVRFGLSSRCGLSSFATALRRTGSPPEIAPHLQQLPGGLDVLVGGRNLEGGDSMSITKALLSSAASDAGGPWDLLVDVGRVVPAASLPGDWWDHCDAATFVLRSDVASVLKMRDAAPELLTRCEDRAGLVVIPTGEYSSAEIERFTGIPVIGEIPHDPASAGVVAGGRGSARRLSRSLLVASAARLAATLSKEAAIFSKEEVTVDGPEPLASWGLGGETVPPSSLPSSRRSGRARLSGRVRNGLTNLSTRISPAQPEAQDSSQEVLR